MARINFHTEKGICVENNTLRGGTKLWTCILLRYVCVLYAYRGLWLMLSSTRIRGVCVTFRRTSLLMDADLHIKQYLQVRYLASAKEAAL